jgi:lipopolysaccharide assembly outer membrane protein LptD (OstA)
MRSYQQRLSICSRAYLCAVVAIGLCGCGSSDSAKATKPHQSAKQAAKVKPAPPEQTGPKLALSQTGITLRWVENGKLRMSATAKEFRGNEVTKKGELLDFSGQLYENGRPATTMTAPKVIADTQNRIVTATGGVVIRSLLRKTVVRSQWAKWYQNQQKIVGNGGVTIKSDTWDVKAAAFVADTGLKTLSVRNSAKGL